MAKQLVVSAVALMLLFAAPAAARTMTVFSHQPAGIGGKTRNAFVPVQVLSVADKRGVALAQSIFAKLSSRKQTLYADVKFSVSGSAGSLMIGKQCASPGVVAGELFLSLMPHGFTLTVDGKTFGFRDLVDPAFVTVYAPWQALPPLKLAGGFVVAGENLLTMEAFRKRLAARDRAITATLLSMLDQGSDSARVRVLIYLTARKTLGLTPRLIPLLTPTISSKVKLLALAALRGQRGKKVVAAAEAVVAKDPDPAVKTAAVQLLIAAGVKKYAFILDFNKLNSTDDSVVIAAIGRLQRAQNSAVVSALLRSLSHRSDNVRRAALTAIAGYRQWKSLASALALDAIPLSTRLRIAETLKGCDHALSKGVGLGFLVQHGSVSQAKAACKPIATSRLVSAADPLAKALLRGDETLQRLVLKTLGTLGQVASLRHLAQFATTHRGQAKAVTSAAVSILSQQTLTVVMALVKHKLPWIRQWAIQSLGTVALKQGDVGAEVTTTLLEALKAPETPIRRAAMYALARTKKQSIIHKLLGYAKDRDADLRGQLAVALSLLSSAKSATVLIELLSDESDDVKVLAIVGVAKRRLPAALEQLKRMANYGAVPVRREVLATLVVLAKPGDASLLAVYSARLFDDDEAVKLAAIAGLKKITGRRVVAALGGALLDPSAAVKKAALDALASALVPEAWNQIAKSLADADPGVRKAALLALGKLKNAAAKKTIRAFADSEKDPSLRKLAVSVLAKL